MSEQSRTLRDKNIIRRILDGDVNAFEYLLKEYQGHVLAIIKGHIPFIHVEETAQEVFIKAYQALPTLKHRDRFKQWLSSIAIRTCQDFWRKQYRSKERTISDLTDRQQDWLKQVLNEQSEHSFNESWKQKEAREMLDWALYQLSPKDRMILELVYLEDHSLKEAAELMGISVANLKVRSFRSRRKLGKLLSSHSTEHGRVS